MHKIYVSVGIAPQKYVFVLTFQELGKSWWRMYINKKTQEYASITSRHKYYVAWLVLTVHKYIIKIERWK